MKLSEKFSKRFGFTNTETNVILFIALFCLVGLAVNILKNSLNNKSFLEFDYKEKDSLFNAAGGDPGIEDTSDGHQQKIIDSKSELMDFTSEKIKNINKEKSVPGSKKINLNTASISEINSIPGIGSKVAERIIEYRDKYGMINNADDLLNIKGIGKTKLKKILIFISLN